jgi:hypothetical protein
MRTLSAAMLASIVKTITDPVYLFKIDFGTGYVYATSREAIVYDLDNYSATGAEMKRIDSKRVSFTLPNFDRSISALAFAGQIQGNECLIYLHYDGETVGRFVGLLDAPSCGGDYNYVTITAVDTYATVSRWPHERMTKPVFNHLPAPNTIISLGNTDITLEPDGGR